MNRIAQVYFTHYTVMLFCGFSGHYKGPNSKELKTMLLEMDNHIRNLTNKMKQYNLDAQVGYPILFQLNWGNGVNST